MDRTQAGELNNNNMTDYFLNEIQIGDTVLYIPLGSQDFKQGQITDIGEELDQPYIQVGSEVSFTKCILLNNNLGSLEWVEKPIGLWYRESAITYK